MVDAAPRAFVSYARSDAAFVLKVAQQLRLQGCKVWVDQLDIPKGARWDGAVEDALRASGCLMVVLTPAAVKSQNVLDEVAFALDEKRAVLPILLQPVAVPFRLKRLQYIASISPATTTPRSSSWWSRSMRWRSRSRHPMHRQPRRQRMPMAGVPPSRRRPPRRPRRRGQPSLRAMPPSPAPKRRQCGQRRPRLPRPYRCSTTSASAVSSPTTSQP